MTWDRSNKKTAARGYGARHQRLRKALLPKAYGTPCVRCGLTMYAWQDLHFDHTDTRDGYLGFSHAWCNVEAAMRKAGMQQAQVQAITAHRW